MCVILKNQYFSVTYLYLLFTNYMAKPSMSAVQGRKSAENARIRQMVRSMIAANVELKRYVVAFTGITTSTAGSVSPVTQGIVQGDSLLTRDGDQIIVKNLWIRYQLTMNTGMVNTQRLIVFWDNQANGATPAVGEVLNSASWITGYNPVIQQQRRFHILLDKAVVASNNGSNTSNNREWKFKLNHRVTFLGTTDVATANGRGAMFVLFISDGANALYSASFSIEFTDS